MTLLFLSREMILGLHHSFSFEAVFKFFLDSDFF